MKFLRICGALAAAAVLSSCQPAPEGPKLALADCRLPGIEAAARCGTHEVWEDRKAQAGRRIKIRVVVIPAKLRAKEPDPIVPLAGGPGQGAVGLARQLVPLFSQVNSTRDLLFVDQRGTGSSNPLNCDQDGPMPSQALFEDAIPDKVLQECLRTIDADPRHYGTTTAMADLDEIRGLLGYQTVNLWGGSYGTRAALEYLRRYPDRVRTATLDGVAPMTMKLPLSFAADGAASLERMLNSCAIDPLCEKAYPNLRKTLNDLRTSLARRAVNTSIVDPLTGQPETVLVSENVLLSALFRPLYLPELASLLPAAIVAAKAGDFSPLLAQNLEIADDIVENFAIGMHLSVLCAEDVPRITPEDIADLQKTFFGRAMVEQFLGACKFWPRGEVAPDYYEPVRANVPVLIFSGGLDPATPPRHGELVAASLPKSKHFVAPFLGHGVSSHGCAPRLIERFIRTGTTNGMDGACLERIPRPLFVLPLGTKP
ncbi:alpha/beta fold hydrolase [Usitatibacter palustris]|uniref:Carboxylesterase B n=1 Tax=Usitatibacter palustris TaxID=2732487 RepID=A0A6M4H7Z8_9PROT|nr:alpha/beta fold hydrolase [Usitatibacter palustris]QJR14988.1 Carboxylesterase B [Usitatibacter palustris]